MKALVYHGPGQRGWDDVPDPTIIDPTDIVVRIDTSTICGSDLHILKGDVPETHDPRPDRRRQRTTSARSLKPTSEKTNPRQRHRGSPPTNEPHNPSEPTGTLSYNGSAIRLYLSGRTSLMYRPYGDMVAAWPL